MDMSAGTVHVTSAFPHVPGYPTFTPKHRQASSALHHYIRTRNATANLPSCLGLQVPDLKIPNTMASESRLYTFSDETKTKLRKFRLGTSRAKDPQAVIYEIDKKTLEVRPVDDEVYTDVGSVADELPDHAPRFVLLSYPLTLDSGRLSVPYVMLYYLPITCNSEVKMLYAGAKELMRNTAEVNRIIEIDNAEDLDDIEDKLKES
ncbi:uncharacterized protein EKO05_0009015 [Ascochyta rabiei]|uniref:uncharacterized protein n=1 Tax=Didymella rabiei TaxID=5454 RepID=UPI0021FAAC4B|nr:uncharacterized protein EKO05_0009015 [Ascochyta rabiei]UPX18723.1 hypothetical protein EKO05_0009015 [Ascochyta rabiei]